MQETSELWRELLRAGARVEYRVEAAGVTYEQDRIASLEISSGLFASSSFELGACVSAQLELELWNASAIPRNAEIKVFARLAQGARASEWLPSGVYYIDTRRSVPESGTLELTCYDAMLKAEQVFWTGEGGTDTWPRKMAAVVATICTRMGVQLDERTVLRSYDVEFPNDLTMREILGYIAAAHAGCWVMTPAGRLRLITLGALAPETHYLVDEIGDAITFGGVRILV